jgi:hypothetical protein
MGPISPRPLHCMNYAIALSPGRVREQAIPE